MAELIDDLGYIPVCCGELTNARYLEAMAMLWIQLAFVQEHGINFTFKVVGSEKGAGTGERAE